MTKNAVRLLRPLAEQGDARAQYQLGTRYFTGAGVSQDYAEALKWFRLSADQENADGQGALGSMYYTGRGVHQDYVLAHMWFNLSAARGAKPEIALCQHQPSVFRKALVDHVGIRSGVNNVLAFAEENERDIGLVVFVDHQAMHVLPAFVLQIPGERSTNAVCQNIHELKTMRRLRRKSNVLEQQLQRGSCFTLFIYRIEFFIE